MKYLLPAAVSLTARLLFLLGADFLLTGMVGHVAALASLRCALLAPFAYRARATAALALVIPFLAVPVHAMEQMLFDRRLEARLDEYLAAGPH